MSKLNDQVEFIHGLLIEDHRYLMFLEAVWDLAAVEGSLVADDHEAAHRIRWKAREIGSPVADEKLATIVKALHVVLRRAACTRKERRFQLTERVSGDGFVMTKDEVS